MTATGRPFDVVRGPLGCVNLSPADAEWFFDHFGIGDVVEVTNSGGPPLPIWDRWGDWALSWAQWQGT